MNLKNADTLFFNKIAYFFLLISIPWVILCKKALVYHIE